MVELLELEGENVVRRLLFRGRGRDYLRPLRKLARRRVCRYLVVVIAPTGAHRG